MNIMQSSKLQTLCLFQNSECNSDSTQTCGQHSFWKQTILIFNYQELLKSKKLTLYNSCMKLYQLFVNMRTQNLLYLIYVESTFIAIVKIICHRTEAEECGEANSHENREYLRLLTRSSILFQIVITLSGWILQ